MLVYIFIYIAWTIPCRSFGGFLKYIAWSIPAPNFLFVLLCLSIGGKCDTYFRIHAYWLESREDVELWSISRMCRQVADYTVTAVV